jgi:hypothetical protein
MEGAALHDVIGWLKDNPTSMVILDLLSQTSMTSPT